MWMVRAGQGGHLADEFSQGFVGIGWEELGDLSEVTSVEEISSLYSGAYPKDKSEKSRNAVANVYRFRSVISVGDRVVTYIPQTREYLIGDIETDYQFRPGRITSCAHLRLVSWEGRIRRDAVSAAAREMLRNPSMVFPIDELIAVELLAVMAGEPVPAVGGVSVSLESLGEVRRRVLWGWMTVGFGIFILAMGLFLYFYAAGQISYLEEIRNKEEVTTVTVFFWLGKELTTSSSEFQDVIDILERVKIIGLGAEGIGAIMLLAGILQLLMAKRRKLTRIL